MKPQEIVISSFEDFVKYVSYNCKDKRTRIFRGQRNEKPLYSRLYRLINQYNKSDRFYEIEKNILSEFRKSAYLYNNRINDFNDWEILSVAQHFGLPTRLIDWTSNPLVGLWFAFEKEKDNDENRVVWGLVVDNDTLVDINTDNPFNQEYTKVFKPKYIDPRINAQNSWFSIESIDLCGKRKGGDGLPIINTNVSLDRNEEFDLGLVKLKIPNSERINILRNLDLMGINHFTLFPGLDGLCKNIEWKEFKK
jgi:hypothetical protein